MRDDVLVNREPSSPSEAVAAAAEPSDFEEFFDELSEAANRDPAEETEAASRDQPAEHEADEQVEATVQDVGRDPSPEQSEEVEQTAPGEEGREVLRSFLVSQNGASEELPPAPTQEPIPSGTIYPEETRPSGAPTMADLGSILADPEWRRIVSARQGPLSLGPFSFEQRDLPRILAALAAAGLVDEWPT